MPPKPFMNHYQTLDLPITAKPTDIIHAYDQKLQDLNIHSQENTHDSENIHLQIQLDDAYHILTHRFKKTVYDKLYCKRLIQEERTRTRESRAPFEMEKVLKWRCSLHRGGPEEREAEYGRVAGVGEWEVDERCLWAPSLMCGAVVELDGWED